MPIWQKTEEELQQDNIPPPFWAFAWAGGQALARYLLDHREIVAGKRVLDIGTGSGMTAIAAKLAGAAHVTASDIDTLAVTAVELNAALNEVSLKVISQDVLCEPMPSFDVFIVADLFYERALAESVMVFCQKAKQQGATVLIGDPKRNYFPVDAFTCLETYQVDVTRELEDTLIKRTGVWRL